MGNANNVSYNGIAFSFRNPQKNFFFPISQLNIHGPVLFF